MTQENITNPQIYYVAIQMNIYVYFQSHDLFNSNATYLDKSIGHFIKMCMDSHLQHHELEEIPLNWFAVKH